jgi:hypothetical protein
MATPLRPAISPGQLQAYGIAVGIEGGTMAAYEYGISYLKKQKFMFGTIKVLKNWTDTVLAVVISIVAYILLANMLPEHGVRAIRVLGSWGVKEAILVGIRHRPVAVLTANNTVEVFGLDASKTVEVWVDGSKVSFETAPSTDGAGYAKITLPTTLTAGAHKVLAHTGFKATFVEQYVE